MKAVNSICDNISNYLAKELNLDQEKIEVVNYGIFAIIQMIINIVCVIIFGVILKGIF